MSKSLHASSCCTFPDCLGTTGSSNSSLGSPAPDFSLPGVDGKF